MTAVRVRPPAAGLCGELSVPGDKSIAHRALLLGALAEGATVISGFPGGADTLSTLAAVRALGADAVREGDVVRVVGGGLALARGTRTGIDCGNSGTTMRLAAGLAAGGCAEVVFDGDASLRRRPMERVAEPLRRMGAVIETHGGCAPIAVRSPGTLRAIDFELRVASAQVKSAVLLAGLRARGTTRVAEPIASRDHTERLLAHLAAPTRRDGRWIAVEGGRRLVGAEVPLPGDVSSAAFLVVAAALVPGSTLRLADVGLNATRTGALEILRRMGAAVEVRERRDVAGEPRGELIVRASRLHGTTIGAADIPGAIDELPVLAIAAAAADGVTSISGAAELRVKESDRLAALEQLGVLGVRVEGRPDGLVIHGRGGAPLDGGRIDAAGDHRIAMAFAIAGLLAPDGVEIADPACVSVSFPGFFAALGDAGARIEACP